MESLKPNSQKKITIYSENTHDYYFLSVLTIFFNSHNYNEITVITYSNKRKRIQDNLDEILHNFDTKIRYLNLVSQDLRIFRLLNSSKLKYLYKIPMKVIDILLLSKYFLINLRKTDLFVNEIYLKSNAWLMYIFSKWKDINYRYITLHNLNKFNPSNSIFYKLSERFEHHIVLSNFLKETASTLYPNKSFLVFPAAIPSLKTIDYREKILNEIDSDVIRFCVTGSVEESRKDYQKILDLFREISKESYQLIFLGKLNSKWVQKVALENDINAIFYEEFVPDAEFFNKISNAHFLLTMNKQDNYMQNKISGIMYDAIRYALPLISNNPTFQHDSLLNIIVDNNEKLSQVIYKSNNNYHDFYGKKSLRLSKQSLSTNVVDDIFFV